MNILLTMVSVIVLLMLIQGGLLLVMVLTGIMLNLFDYKGDVYILNKCVHVANKLS